MAEKSLKTLVITSRVTFTPGNYDYLINGLAACPQVAGLLILDNRNAATLARSVGAVVHGAYRLGMALLVNHFGNSQRRREHAYGARKKPVWTVKRLNSTETLRIIDENKFDLLLNARTRVFFDKQLIDSAPLGAINIHHGLLPEQRGTMCDLWSLSNHEPCGFSLHKMNAEIDGGDILKVVNVSDGSEKDYMSYLEASAREELKTVSEVLAQIETTWEIRGTPNIKTGNFPYRRDPSPTDIKRLKRRELQI